MAAKAPIIPDSSLETLRPGFRGELYRPGDRGYNDVRKVHNGLHASKRPALIMRCTGTADVVAAIQFARAHPELPLSVRGGGHSVAGYSTNSGGIVIDLSKMQGVHVDPDRRIARAQGGTTWGIYDRETQSFGLASPGGLVSTTGIAGLTLGGGIGLLSYKYGLACDSLIGAQIVMADGRVLLVDEDHNPDLLWGLRGGGGNFGIVTQFHYKLHPVADVTMGLFMHPVDKAAEMLAYYRKIAPDMPRDMLVFTQLATLPMEPPMPIFPQEILGKQICAFLSAWVGPPEEAAKAQAPLRDFGKPIFELSMPIPYTMAQQLQEDESPWGSFNYWKTAYANELSDDLIDVVASRAPTSPSPRTAVVVGRFGGAIADVSEAESAFPLRDAGYLVQMDSIWTDKTMSKEQTAWAKSFASEVAPHATDRAYVNFFGDEGQTRVKKAYGKKTYERLVALKDTYDPENVFRINQNIKPSK